MSRNLKHYQALDALATHALLALYCTMSKQGGFWTVKRRNERLVKFIKPKVKQPQFSTCKPEIKTMLSIGRNPIGNLEQKLWDVNRLNLEYQAKFSQADELYIMLSGLFEQHQFPSMLEDIEKGLEVDTLYMKEKGIENGFDEDNNQIKPLAMTVKTHRLKALIEAVQANGIYRVEVDHVDEHEVIHLLLHRKG
ncbi:DUF2913 family protein [Vibrio sp. 10N.261.52.A1]|uniref:DUF2913 family protein n=1 Tax=Vibrio sp. 10N.261.52.A1 TaxID=1880849 RepID=UPI000C861583|nr:DUF2913 family protein [Vibrio sp. 10N.261.52.A1]PML40329.1 hypothetical protein BCT81_02780 [Vibrio sp. 10N.261.52.A1]